MPPSSSSSSSSSPFCTTATLHRPTSDLVTVTGVCLDTSSPINLVSPRLLQELEIEAVRIPDAGKMWCGRGIPKYVAFITSFACTLGGVTEVVTAYVDQSARYHLHLGVPGLETFRIQFSFAPDPPRSIPPPLVTVSPSSAPCSRYILAADDPSSEAMIVLLTDPKQIQAAMAAGQKLKKGGGAHAQHDVRGLTKKQRKRKRRDTEEQVEKARSELVRVTLVNDFEPEALKADHGLDGVNGGGEEAEGSAAGEEEEEEEEEEEAEEAEEAEDAGVVSEEDAEVGNEEEEEIVFKGRGISSMALVPR